MGAEMWPSIQFNMLLMGSPLRQLARSPEERVLRAASWFFGLDGSRDIGDRTRQTGHARPHRGVVPQFKLLGRHNLAWRGIVLGVGWHLPGALLRDLDQGGPGADVRLGLQLAGAHLQARDHGVRAGAGLEAGEHWLVEGLGGLAILAHLHAVTHPANGLQHINGSHISQANTQEQSA